MSKMKQVFQEEREKESKTLGDYLDDTYQQAEYSNEKTKQVLNDIIEAWGEIFGVKNVSQKIQSNDEDQDFNQYVDKVCYLFNIDSDILFTKTKRRDVVDARHLRY